MRVQRVIELSTLYRIKYRNLIAKIVLSNDNIHLLNETGTKQK